VNILVAGGFDTDNEAQQARVQAFCRALAAALFENGHVLLMGCRTELDRMLAEAAHEKLTELSAPEPDAQLISYVLSGTEPVHEYGTILKSRLMDWEIGAASFYIPEQVQQADAVILVGGFDGTFRAANWARIAKKPLLPLTAFGGAAETVFAQELNEYETKYAGLVTQLEYEQLNSVKSDWADHAADLIALAEKVAESRTVLVIMSYADTDELTDAFETFKSVTGNLGYECERVTQENAGERILPDILEGISRAAFTIVDLTDLRPNVFYELGYADGLGKRVIVTAKKGTELPFDVKDIPTIFWGGQTQLRNDLTKRIMSVVKPGAPRAAELVGGG
jgi:hypothetical protein